MTKKARRAKAAEAMAAVVRRMSSRHLHLGFTSWQSFLWFQDQKEMKLNMVVKILINKGAQMLAKGWRSWTANINAAKSAEGLKEQKQLLAFTRISKVLSQQNAVKLASTWVAWRWWILMSFEQEIAAERAFVMKKSSKVQEGLRVLQYLCARSEQEHLKVAFHQWLLLVQSLHYDQAKMNKFRLLLQKNSTAWHRMLLRRAFLKLCHAATSYQHTRRFRATQALFAPFLSDRTRLKDLSRALKTWCLFTHQTRMKNEQRDSTEKLENEMLRTLVDARKETKNRTMRYLCKGWSKRMVWLAWRQWRLACNLLGAQSSAARVFCAVAKRTASSRLQHAFFYWKKVHEQLQAHEVSLLVQNLRNGQGAKAIVGIFRDSCIKLLCRSFRRWKDILDRDHEAALRFSLKMDLVREKQLKKILKDPPTIPQRPASLIERKRQHNLKLVVLHSMKRQSYSSSYTEELQNALQKWRVSYLTS
mmetsp:Transcript_7763/g.10200  ORF Transcript_7763/g.10200 Transcript_7763/m.10200 type:complete len:475 (-) Transcript_7763:199-1623(-)